MSRARWRPAAVAALLAVVASLVSGVVTPQPAGAVGGKTFLVDVLTDSVDASPGDGACLDSAGACSLRAAVMESNAVGEPANTIVLSAGATYALSRSGTAGVADTSAVGDLDISSPVEIVGNGAAIDAAPLRAGPTPLADRVLEVKASKSATLRAITVKNGDSGAATENGGGILTAGELVLDRVVLIDNDTASNGGGVFYTSSSSGSIRSSVIVHNDAAAKGGGVRANASIPITSSTVSHNRTATNTATGVFVGNNTTVTFTGTILDNPTSSGGSGVDCLTSPPAAGNPSTSFVASTGYNLSRSAAPVCGLTQTTDKPSTIPNLFLDVVPFPGDPSIDGGGPTCPGLDVYGTSRPRGVACDIGAFEATPSFTVTSTTDTVDAVPGNGVCADAGGACSLRAAVMEGNALPGPKTITLAAGATYPLTRKGLPDTSSVGDLDITAPVTIEGNGATVDAAGLVPITVGSTYGDRVLEVSSTGDATVRRLTMINGNTDTSGGGAQVAGKLDLDRVVLRDNRAASSGGGAFYNSAATGTVASTIVVHNTAEKGGGLRVNKTLTLTSSTISHNTATTPSYGHGVYVGPGAVLTTGASLLDNPTAAGAGGYDCSVNTTGAITSTGYNLSRSANPVCRLTATGDQPGTDPGALFYDVAPVGASPAIDGGGPTCPTVDVNGYGRPQGPACDVGAVESPPTRQYTALANIAKGPVNATCSTTRPPGTTPVETCPRELIARAYSRYQLGDAAGGRADLTTLSQLPYTPADPSDPDAAPGNGVTGIPAGWPIAKFYQWEFEFDFIHVLRLEVINPPPGWSSDPIRPTVLQWIATNAADCRRDANNDGTIDDLYTYLHGSGPTTGTNSENHMLLESVECMLSLYSTRSTNGTAWQMWANALRAWLKVNARSGLLGEIMSPIYGKYSLSAIMNLADFTVDSDLQAVTRRWLDVFWQDVALNYNAQSKIVGASGSRMYQFDPDTNAPAGSYYGQAANEWFRAWTWLYGWHDIGTPGAIQIVSPATSTYLPLAMSAQVANATGKSISYTSRRPFTIGAGAEANPGVIRRVEQNDDYLLGAQTYDTTLNMHLGKREGIWAGVSVNGTDPDARVLISGVGESKSGNDSYTDYSGIQARLSNNVIVAARDHVTEVGGTNAGNSRGIRVWFGPALREHLEEYEETGWWFTYVGHTYVAVRFAAAVEARSSTDTPPGKTSELRISDPLGSSPGHCVSSEDPGTNGCCPPTGPDCWAPVVVQVGRWTPTYSFGNFQADVLQAGRYSYDAGTGTVSYTSLAGEQFSIARQESARIAPTVDDAALSMATTKPFDHPYLTMNIGSTTAQLCSPAPVTCVTRDFA